MKTFAAYITEVVMPDGISRLVKNIERSPKALSDGRTFTPITHTPKHTHKLGVKPNEVIIGSSTATRNNPRYLGGKSVRYTGWLLHDNLSNIEYPIVEVDGKYLHLSIPSLTSLFLHGTLSEQQDVFLRLSKLQIRRGDIYIPDGSLNVARSEMPQIQKEDVPAFLKWLQHDKNVPVISTEVACTDLKATQGEINKEKVLELIQKDPVITNIIVSADNYVLDGHHRWLADLNRDRTSTCSVYRADCTILELLRLAKDFQGSFSKNIHEESK